jgi:hypothetical protein
MRIEALNLMSLLQVSNKRIHDVKLDFVGVQEIRWKEGGIESADIYTCFCSKGNAIHYFGTFSYIEESNDDRVCC